MSMTYGLHNEGLSEILAWAHVGTDSAALVDHFAASSKDLPAHFGKEPREDAPEVRNSFKERNCKT